MADAIKADPLASFDKGLADAEKYGAPEITKTILHVARLDHIIKTLVAENRIDEN